MRVSSALERRIDMWNEKHDVYGWNLNSPQISGNEGESEAM